MKKLCALCVLLSFLLTGCGLLEELPFLRSHKSRDKKDDDAIVEDMTRPEESAGNAFFDGFFTPEEDVAELAPEEMVGDSTLRFDGLYCYIETPEDGGNPLNYSFRFYEDGTVISVTTSRSSPDQSLFPAKEWFNKDNSGMAGGTYTVEGNEIKFSSTSLVGTVDYEGTLGAGRMILDSYSHINGFQSEDREYVFYSDKEIEKSR